MTPDISTLIPVDLDSALERNDVAYLWRVARALLAEVERTADGAKAIETLAEIKSEIDYARDSDEEYADKDCLAEIALLVAAP